MNEFIPCKGHCDFRHNCIKYQSCDKGTQETFKEVNQMRYWCYICKKSVTTELPDDSVIRAVLICPECISIGRVEFPNDNPHSDPERARGTRSGQPDTD